MVLILTLISVHLRPSASKVFYALKLHLWLAQLSCAFLQAAKGEI